MYKTIGFLKPVYRYTGTGRFIYKKPNNIKSLVLGKNHRVGTEKADYSQEALVLRGTQPACMEYNSGRNCGRLGTVGV